MPNNLTYNPSEWHTCSENDYLECENGVNCYSYALNNPRYYWSVPGLGYVKSKPKIYFDSFNQHFSNFSLNKFKESLRNGAVTDGLIQVAEQTAQEEYYLAALFVKDDPHKFDFHWYRRDDNYTWSHKDGWHSVSNLDSRGHTIKDPRENPHPGYSLFAGFFLVPKEGIKLSKTFPVHNRP